MTNSFLDYLFSPIYRGPFLGSLFMSLVTSLVGVFIFLKKKCLVSETLSHASFPGVALAVFLSSFFLDINSPYLSASILIGAFFFSAIALFFLHYLEKNTILKNDTILCYLLAFCFAIGLLFISQMQFSTPLFYKKSLSYLYGQVATMTDIHVFIFGSLFTLTVLLIFLFYHPIYAYLFDERFFLSLGFPKKIIEYLLLFLLLLSIVIGISSVGVVLLSGMLIAPVLAARQWTDKFLPLCLISLAIGFMSSFLGVIGSVELSLIYKISFPTGPSIVLVAGTIAFLSLLFAPKKGYFFTCVRHYIFRINCREENILKCLLRKDIKTKKQIQHVLHLSYLNIRFLLIHMKYTGWLEVNMASVQLTKDGTAKAKKIVRLHRLWEVYLADHLGIGIEKVHKSAEQIEHFITEDLEKKLTQFLDDPKEDPHQKPIPDREC